MIINNIIVHWLVIKAIDLYHCFCHARPINLIYLSVLAALEYLLHNPGDAVDIAALEAAAGVGVVVSPDEIEEAVSTYIPTQTGQKTRRQRNSYNLSFKPNTTGYTTIVS